MSDFIKISVDSNLDEVMQDIKDEVASAVLEVAEGPFDIDCPDCGKHISVYPGHDVCPFCHEDINVSVKLDT